VGEVSRRRSVQLPSEWDWAYRFAAVGTISPVPAADVDVVTMRPGVGGESRVRWRRDVETQSTVDDRMLRRPWLYGVSQSAGRPAIVGYTWWLDKISRMLIGSFSTFSRWIVYVGLRTRMIVCNINKNSSEFVSFVTCLIGPTNFMQRERMGWPPEVKYDPSLKYRHLQKLFGSKTRRMVARHRRCS